MSTVHLVRVLNGLVPATDDDASMVNKVPMGSVVKVELTQMRNGKFFRKWWALAKVAYDIWCEDKVESGVEFKGQVVRPSFDRFRKELTVLAGFYTPVWNINGDMRVEAASLQWSKMSEEAFERLYAKTLDVIINKVLANRKFSEKDIDEMVERVMHFA